jgi:DNA-directed RNA polymerase subunit RPC12/RpoP
VTSVNADDITKPGGMQRLLEKATADEGHTAIMCDSAIHASPVEMQREDDAATCPDCGMKVRLVWVPE